MEYSDNYYTRTKTYSPYFNKLSESLQCDVCIIGGGLSGISTAYYLSKINPNLNVVVLEKHKVGWGASGRNGGQLLHGFLGSYSCMFFLQTAPSKNLCKTLLLCQFELFPFKTQNTSILGHNS